MHQQYRNALLCLALLVASAAHAAPFDKLAYHQNTQRTGWNDHETMLTPKVVRGAEFGQLWQTEQLDMVDGQAPRLFATPLYVDRVAITTGAHRGKTFPVIYAASDVGFAYAISAARAHGVAAGTILWKTRLAAVRPSGGNLSTPVIEVRRKLIYLVSGDGKDPYRVHALALGSGRAQPGWPVALDAASINVPGINRNGATQFPGYLLIQRGALTLSPDNSRLYVAFGGSGSGWLVGLDTLRPRVATAFSSTARTEEGQGGMWASSGAAVDRDGYVHIATGASVHVHLQKLGLAGVFPDSEHNWGQSILRLRDDPAGGFKLVGTYSPFNYAQAQVTDIDLASSGTILIDLDPATTSTPRLLMLGGMKQGNAYLLDRANMPGSLIKRPAIGADAASDGSLLAPEPQPQFGTRGPLNVFGPYADENAMNDQARSRTTAAYLRTSAGKHYVFMTGSAKTGPKLEDSKPPGLARLAIVTTPGAPAFLRTDQLEVTQTFHNPSSPIVTSHGGRDAIVWVIDNNAKRTTALRGINAPRPFLYAFDALTFELLWRSAPGELATTGKYNEATVANGTVFVGTDRIQAFGVRGANWAKRAPIGSPFLAATASVSNAAPALIKKGEAVYTQRCAVCHGSGQPGIPPRETLSRFDSGHIAYALTSGLMRAQAAGLTPGEIDAVAAYLPSLPASR
ncbi:MAG: c-type cytochrome [Pseudomonadota bacterium]